MKKYNIKFKLQKCKMKKYKLVKSKTQNEWNKI